MGRQKKMPPIPLQPLDPIYRPVDPEAREQHMISLAVDLAEQRLRDGTASSQIIEHYLRLGSSKSAIECALMQEELELRKARTESIRAERTEEEKYQKAIEAMRIYSGMGEPEEYYD